MITTTYLGTTAKVAKPTLKHRPAVWENMLGTVYAMNDKFVTKYFDYDHDGALDYAGVTASRDLRVSRNKCRSSWSVNGTDPRYNQRTLWIKEKQK